MFNVDDSIVAGIKASADYKIIKTGDMTYIFPSSADFKALDENRSFLLWERQAAMVINSDGRVIKNRYGPVTR